MLTIAEVPSHFEQAFKYGTRRKSLIMCANCGGLGHIYKTCNHPTISYGFICFRIAEDEETHERYPTYLMVQRKDSLSYVEFMRGKYDLENRTYVMRLFSNMTKEERDKIHHNADFDCLWKDMWCKGQEEGTNGCKSFNREYGDALEKFNLIKKGYFVKNPQTDSTTFVNIDYYIKNTTIEYDETEWGFPKGRRNVNENDINCAVREFKEETGINPRHLDICADLKPLEEIFSGSNKKRYKHVYYVARIVSNDKDVPFEHPPSCREIKDVKWFTYEEAQSKIRGINVERKELLKRLHQIISKSLNIPM